jgi:cytochrome c oxidase assembly factor CtaG
MSLRQFALDWSVDGPVGTAFLAVVVAVGVAYLGAAARDARRDRRHRTWPRRRSAFFVGGLPCWWSTCTRGSGPKPICGCRSTWSSTW